MNLRGAVLGLSLACAVVGSAILLLFDFSFGAIVALWGVVVLAALIFERIHYKNLALQAPGPGWDRTDERFIDEQTGRPVRVYIQRHTGERRYVQE